MYVYIHIFYLIVRGFENWRRDFYDFKYSI